MSGQVIPLIPSISAETRGNGAANQDEEHH
jgi:hypothetical protein